MALKQPLMIFCVVLGLLAVTGFLYESWERSQVQKYNNAIEQVDFAAASEVYNGPKGVFAKAYNAQQAGDYQQARLLYAPLEKIKDQPDLYKGVMFNIANTYMQQAALLDLEKDADQAFPLVELAKAGYRNLLALDPSHWGAKYNLERALQILPDMWSVRSQSSAGLIRAVQTVLTAESEDNLP